MKLGFKRGQKGFTLVELMVVMAIMAVLAAIVFPAVSGTSEVAGDSQVKQDASTVSNAVNDYFADQTGAEVITTNTTTILSVASIAQVISSRWSESYLQVAYPEEFPTTNTTTVANVIIKISASANITPKGLAEGWNAIDLTTLASNNYIPAVPKSATDESSLGGRSYNNYLWLVEKTTASGGVSGGSRSVQVFKLTGVSRAEGSGGLDTLTYEKIY